MSRFSALTSSLNENTHDSFLDSSFNPDFSPSHIPNSTLSDSESISDESRKISKKRNTYQKISDDIRVQLLEAVQNGETLKAVAKRFNVNYSSAKSILHTYRKEGRILKKSAQERVIKKTDSTPTKSKPAKSPKKENAKNIQNDSDIPFLPLSDRTASMTTCASLTEDNSPIKSNEATKASDKEKQPLAESSLFQYETSTMNFGESLVKTPKQNAMLFDNFFGSHSDFHFPETIMGEANDQSHSHFTNGFDSFNNTMSTYPSRTHQPEEYFHDTNAFLCSQEENNAYYNNYADSYYLQSFIDTQNLLREAFRKASINFKGNSGYRKNSFDLF